MGRAAPVVRLWLGFLIAGCGSKTELGAAALAAPDASGDSGRCGGILCGEAIFGAWGECEFDGLCAFAGFRSRTVLTPTCLAGTCREITGIQTEPCSRDVRGVECRASVLRCDEAEFCDGVSALCPPDEVVDADVMCRPASGECDVAEVCGGATKECPMDRFRPMGTPCSEGGTCMGEPRFCS